MRTLYQMALGLVVAIVGLSACWPAVLAQQDEPRIRRRGSASMDAALDDPAVEKQMKRLREGVSLTDQMGTFVVLGDRIAFQPEGEESAFGVLENLALERVWKVFDDTRGRQWCVSGAVTEYRGRNYLLLTRAVLRAQLATEPVKP